MITNQRNLDIEIGSAMKKPETVKWWLSNTGRFNNFIEFHMICEIHQCYQDVPAIIPFKTKQTWHKLRERQNNRSTLLHEVFKNTPMKKYLRPDFGKKKKLADSSFSRLLLTLHAFLTLIFLFWFPHRVCYPSTPPGASNPHTDLLAISTLSYAG